MRVSRARFSKRRSKRKTSFPIIAIVQKKVRPKYNINQSFSLLRQKSGRAERSTNLPATQQTKQGSLANTSQGEFESKQPLKKSRATIDYKNVVLLRKLITAEGKILPRRITKLTAKQQRSIQKAIKSARVMGLLPFINKSRPFA